MGKGGFMNKFILAVLVLAPLMVGCASTKPATVRSYLPPPGTVGVATTTGVMVQPQQRQYVLPSAPAEEDPLVLQARAIALQNVRDRETWKAACFELRRLDMYATYDDCRRLLGDERNLYGSGYSSYGRSIGGSVIRNSRGVIWK